MKVNNIFLIALLISPLLASSQNAVPTFQSNPNFSFSQLLQSVKRAEIMTTPEQEDFWLSYPEGASVYLGVSSYLTSIGFDDVGFSVKYRGREFPSVCEKVWVIVYYDINSDYINDFALKFVSCNGDTYLFKRVKSAKIGLNTIDSRVHNMCLELYGYKKSPYNPDKRIKLIGETTGYTEAKLKSYLIENSRDQFEGIYENSTDGLSQPKYKLGVKKTPYGYDIIYLSGAFNYLDWLEGDLKGKLTPTATSNLFKADWFMANKYKNTDFLTIFENGLMNILDQNKDKSTYIKLYPISGTTSSQGSSVSGSGTGFAISSSGYIVTNYHVIENAKQIKIRGVNGDFSKSFNAEVYISDKNNDLSIIKISDPSFTSTGSIPFGLSRLSNDVGTSIFVLGYPLRATMGDEVKLTNGIISSKSGYQGDITSYQISAPVQPGNSGGPLFDQDGNVIGIINAKHGGAENASYAVKSNYLFNLLEQIPENIKDTPNSLKGKSLSEQVKTVKNYVYIIEIQ